MVTLIYLLKGAYSAFQNKDLMGPGPSDKPNLPPRHDLVNVQVLGEEESPKPPGKARDNSNLPPEASEGGVLIMECRVWSLE